MFWMNNLLLGIGLAMDAFSVSVANGLREPQMKLGKACMVAGVFALFQGLMPMIGWMGVHTMLRQFRILARLVPWLATAVLTYIGVGMIFNHGGQNAIEEDAMIVMSTILAQGVATSLDALSVGFATGEYTILPAMCSSLIIAGITFAVCLSGVLFGKKAGAVLMGKSEILGGLVLIAVGFEILLSSLH